MPKPIKIKAIVQFVTKHPQSTASRRICRELLGEGLEQFNQELAADFEVHLNNADEHRIDSYYYLIR